MLLTVTSTYWKATCARWVPDNCLELSIPLETLTLTSFSILFPFWFSPGPTWHDSDFQKPQFGTVMTSLSAAGSTSETVSHPELVVHTGLTDDRNHCFPLLLNYFLAPLWVCCKTQGAHCLGTRGLINKNESHSSPVPPSEKYKWDYLRRRPESQQDVAVSSELIFSICFFVSHMTNF